MCNFLILLNRYLCFLSLLIKLSQVWRAVAKVATLGAFITVRLSGTYLPATLSLIVMKDNPNCFAVLHIVFQNRELEP